MVLWGGFLGALFGWLLGSDDAGGVIGAALGALSGWLLQRFVRGEILRALAPLHAEIERLKAVAPSGADVGVDSLIAVAAPIVARADEPPVQVPEPRLSVDAMAMAIPSEPGVLALMLARARNWLLGGNTIVRVGLLLLFVGLAFLANYAAQAGLFPIEFRLALVAVAGIALLAFGFRTRTTKPGFALTLQGGGIAVIYLTLFAAARLFEVAPLGLTFGLMVAVCAFGCTLALLQNAQSLAVTAFLGGFAVPLMLAGEGGSTLALFGYYTVLNLAVLFIAGRRSWRLLNLLGFVATFGTATLWGLTSYQGSEFWLAQAFLIVSVLIYIAAGLLYADRAPGRLGGTVDSALLFGPAIAGFGLQAGLVGDRPFGAAFSALGFAAVYLSLVAVLRRRRTPQMQLMSEAMLAIGVGFVTLAIPLALGARWTSAAWALEGAGAVFVGMRQARALPRCFGLALQIVAALLLLDGLAPNIAPLPFANDTFPGAMLVALSLLATAWWLRAPLPQGDSPLARRYAAFEAQLGQPVFLAGFAVFWLGFALEAFRMRPDALAGLAAFPVFSAATADLLAMLAFVASAWLAQEMAGRTGWAVAAWPARVTFAALALGFLAMLMDNGWALEWAHLALWAAAIALHLHALARQDRAPGRDGAPWLTRAAHIVGVWLVLAMLADGLAMGIDRAALWDTAWAAVSFLLATTIVLLLLALWAAPALQSGAGRPWPLDHHAADYAWTAALPVAALVVIGALATALFAAGDADPLPYVPLLNPVDLSVLLAIATLALWWRRVGMGALPGPAKLGDRLPLGTLAVMAFALLNGAWLRIAHQSFGVPWDGDSLLGSFLVQTGTAILWALAALALMLMARRQANRVLWLGGATLLALTVIKLLVVDLANAGGGARVVAFIGVGVLMLIIGYVAPLPPRPLREDRGV